MFIRAWRKGGGGQANVGERWSAGGALCVGKRAARADRDLVPGDKKKKRGGGIAMFVKTQGMLPGQGGAAGPTPSRRPLGVPPVFATSFLLPFFFSFASRHQHTAMAAKTQDNCPEAAVAISVDFNLHSTALQEAINAIKKGKPPPSVHHNLLRLLVQSKSFLPPRSTLGGGIRTLVGLHTVKYGHLSFGIGPFSVLVSLLYCIFSFNTGK